MSAPPPPTQAPPAAAPQPVAAYEACPLCGAPLAADQEWCLRCGAAARTRLAAAPGWKAPVVALAVVAALALGILAAALVKLAGDSGPAPVAITRTVTTVGAATPTVATTPTTAGPPPTTTTQPPAGTTPTVPGATSTGASTPQG